MPHSPPRIGAHVDQADPVSEAASREAELVQFFLGDPQKWSAPVVTYAGGAAGLREAATAAGVDLYIHAPYVINVATSNNRIRIPSRKLLQQTVDLAAQIGAKGVVVHGGHVLASDGPEIGYDNWCKTFERLELRTPVFIENTAGGGKAMARRLESIARLWDALAARCDLTDVGFCLDTCHAHAGGEELSDVVERIKAIIGRIDLVHANDSKDSFDSGRDRHENLSQGMIDPKLLVEVVAAAEAPVVCETPGGATGQAHDIAWLRERLPSR
jgi:deoxyribonuclease IV